MMTRTQPGDGCPQGMAAEIKALADGELRGIRQRRATAHLNQCAACRSWDQWLRATSLQLRSMDGETAPPALRARIIAAAGAHGAAGQSAAPRRRALLTGAGLVLAAAAAAAAPTIIHRLTMPAVPVHHAAAPAPTPPPVPVPQAAPAAPPLPALSPDEAAVNRETERLYHERMQAAARASNRAHGPAPYSHAYSVQVASGRAARFALLGWMSQNSARLLSMNYQPAGAVNYGDEPVTSAAEITVVMRTTTRRLPQLEKLLSRLVLPTAAPPGPARHLPIPTVGGPVTPRSAAPASTVNAKPPPVKAVKAARIAPAPAAAGGRPVRVLVILRLPATPGK